MSDDEFNRYTLSQIRALISRYENEKKEQEYFHALICSVIANVNSGKGKIFKPKDFMRKENKKQTTEEMLMILQALSFGGA